MKPHARVKEKAPPGGGLCAANIGSGATRAPLGFWVVSGEANTLESPPWILGLGRCNTGMVMTTTIVPTGAGSNGLRTRF